MSDCSFYEIDNYESQHTDDSFTCQSERIDYLSLNAPAFIPTHKSDSVSVGNYQFRKPFEYHADVIPTKSETLDLTTISFKVKYKTEMCRNWEEGTCPFST